MANLEREQLLLTIPEVSFEVTMTLACSSFFALTYIISFHALSIDIVATAANSSSLVPKIPFAWVRGYKIYKLACVT